MSNLHCVVCQKLGIGKNFNATIIFEGNSLCWEHYKEDNKK